MTTMMMAGNVTPEQALQKATQFIQNRQQTTDNGSRRAPGTKPQLTLASRVSGLYVFNVQDNGGYVIISPDDRTVPVLGYSDFGSFDPQNIPENMQAWLDGYARQLDWLQTQEQPTSVVKREERNPVEPLVTAQWDQGSPFYNSCPKKGNKRCYTGCVATAMAMIMHYYQYPDATQQYIPSYTYDGVSVDAIPMGSAIDWAHIQKAYGYYYDYNAGTWRNATSSSVQKKAVADLMFYCGAAVNMEYTPDGSGTQSVTIPYALTATFGYDATARLLDRNRFSDNNWEEIIYYELANGRPVLYSGLTKNNEGHEFVCDGYQGEGYFHINWGWASSGNVDGYFLLSALDPDSQGAGGSSTSDAFNYYQDAVIGIQPPGTGGDVSPAVNEGSPDLELTSMTISKNPAEPGGTVKVSITVKNNGVKNYSNYICIARYDDIESTYKYFNTSISAGASKSCNATFSVPSDREAMQFAVFYYASYSDIYFLGISEYVMIGNVAPQPPSTIDLTFADSEWMLFSNAQALDFTGSGVTPYVVTGQEESVVQMTAVSKVPQETGLLLKGKPNQTYTLNIATGSMDDVSANRLVAIMEDGKKIAKVAGGTVRFYLGTKDEKPGFAKLTETLTLNAGDAYLALPGSSTEFEGIDWLALEAGTTSIGSMTVRPATTDNYYYTLDGRRVTEPITHGIYIYQGKKIRK